MEFNITNHTDSFVGQKPQLGDTVQLTNQKKEVVVCQETGVLMLNIDADQITKGDLTFIKKLGLTISNPDTDKPVALGVDFKDETWGHRIKKFFEEKSSDDTEEDDDEYDDSRFFSSTGSLLGGSSFGSFGGGFVGGGGFGGFGGGSFGGGGAARGF